MRLIDADALMKTLGIDAIDCDRCGWGDKTGRCVRGSDFEDACCAIEDAPTIEPPYELDEWCADCKEYDQERNCCPRYNRVIRAAVEEERANFVPKTGRWIKVGNNAWKCSYCSEISCCESPYCGECGAKMEEVTE